MQYREKTWVSRGKMGLFGELQEESGSLGPLEGGFHSKDFDHQVGDHHGIAFEEDVREEGCKAVEHRVVFRVLLDVQTPEKVGVPGRHFETAAEGKGESNFP